MESQGWSGVEGTVSKVVDGRTILLVLDDDHELLRIRLAGIALDHRAPFSKQAAEALMRKLLNEAVEVFVNPRKWEFGDKHPRRVVGVVNTRNGIPNDPGITLLAQGLVRFERPRPYTMSSYAQCQYRQTEAEARAKHVGLWR